MKARSVAVSGAPSDHLTPGRKRQVTSRPPPAGKRRASLSTRGSWVTKSGSLAPSGCSRIRLQEVACQAGVDQMLVSRVVPMCSVSRAEALRCIAGSGSLRGAGAGSSAGSTSSTTATLAAGSSTRKTRSSQRAPPR